MTRPHQYWKQEDPSQFTSSAGHEAPPFTLVLNLQDKGSWGFLVQQPVSGPVHGDPSHGGCFLQDAVSRRGLSAKPAWLQRGRRRLPDKHLLVTNAFV